MKKLISLLGTIVIIEGSVPTVIAASSYDKKII
ncbi:lipoprotein [Spiroplasma sp. SV19]|nr:lipoprotein [Spiroplasma sp. SV19]